MFTGIIQGMGAITAIEPLGDRRITISTSVALDDVTLGASIACSGVCLTVIEKQNQEFTVQASTETLSKTTALNWQVGTHLNLERALRLGDELGGHMLSGHVDGVAYVTNRRVDGESIRLQFEAPPEFTRFLAPKGSVGLDGVSLTINEVEQSRFGVNIIPHTQQVTTIGGCKVGDAVNFEVDMIARYVDRLMQRSAA